MLCFLGILASVPCCAQDSRLPDAKFGFIPDSLKDLRPPADNPDVPYIITNKEVDVSFKEDKNSIFAIIKYHTRLKVFDKTDPEASIITIPYYFKNNMEQISSIRGETYLASGQKVPLQRTNIRTVNINERYNIKEFTMPSVKDGAVLEYTYTIKRRYIEELPDLFLSDRVPTSVAKVTITYPGYLRYKPYFENLRSPVQHHTTLTDTSTVPKIFTYPQPDPIVTDQWVAYDVPAVRKETYISSLNDYRAKVKFLLSQFGIPRQQLEHSWKVVVAKLRRDANPLRVINQNKWAMSVGDSIARANQTASLTTIQDSVFHFLNKNANYSGTPSPYSSKTDSLVLTGQPADQAAINQTLTAMLRGAGIDADPILISTRNSGKINMDVPSFYQFNGQLVRSTINGHTYFMDAGYSHSQPGLISVQSFNGPGLLMKKKAFQWVPVEAQRSLFGIQVTLNAHLQADGTLKGKIISQQRGYPARQIRKLRANGKTGRDILKRSLFEGSPKLTVNKIAIDYIDSYSKPVKITAQFQIEDYATSFSDGLKFRPMIIGYQRKNPFKDTSRDFPVTLDGPEALDVSYSITLPDNFSMQQAKQNHSLEFQGARFKESYDLGAQKLDYRYQININKKTFSLDVFPRLYNLYEHWVNLSNTAWLISK